MIFHETYQKVLDGTKIQTRRPVNYYRHERLINGIVYRHATMKEIKKWSVGNTYAVQPGRGKKSLGKIRIMEIRIEKVQAISCIDMIAEGLKTNLRHIDATMHLLDQWRDLWNSLYAGTKFAWEKNPDVWVLEFELVEKY